MGVYQPKKEWKKIVEDEANILSSNLFVGIIWLPIVFVSYAHSHSLSGICFAKAFLSTWIIQF